MASKLQLRSNMTKRVLLIACCALLCLLLFSPAASADEEIPLIPAMYTGLVNQECNGELEPVASGAVYAYIDGEVRGWIAFTDGKYGKWCEYPCSHDKPLLVAGSSADTGKPVTFVVYVAGYPYPATTDPSPVLWQSREKKRVDLTIPCIVRVQGHVYLEKIYPDDPEPDHSGTTVTATQNGNVVQTVSATDGSYELAGLGPGNCTVVFSRPGWKREELSPELEQGLNELGPVTLLVGDMNGDGEINILDLLWMASKIGPVTPESEIADVNKDGQVNILDLLRVAKNIGK